MAGRRPPKDKVKRLARPDRHAANPATGRVELVGADLADEWEAKMGIARGETEARGDFNGKAPSKPVTGEAKGEGPEAAAAQSPPLAPARAMVRYSVETGRAVCALIREGLGLRKIAERDGMPDQSTIFDWWRDHEEFRAGYDAAYKDSAQVIEQEILETARNIADKDAAQVARSKIEGLKWVASKRDRQRYGDHSDPPPPPPDPDASSKRLARIAELLAMAQAAQATGKRPDGAAVDKPEETEKL